MDYNLFLFGVYFTGMIISLSLAILLQQRWTAPVLIGVMMGFFSFSGNGAMYRGFAVGKASMVALLTGLPAVIVATGAYIFWGETLTGWQLAAFVIIISGILLIRFSGEVLSSNLKGIQWGLIALLFFGINDLSSRTSMLYHADIFPVLFATFGTGSILFCFVWMKNKRRLPIMALRTDSTSPAGRRDSLPTFLRGMAVGITNICGMIGMLLAFTTGVTGLVSAIAASNVLIIVLYAKLFLGEKFNRREWMGVILAFCGLMILHLVH